MKRDWRVDTLRGYFLVCITLDHFYTPLRWFSQYTFGYAASPDGFHLLSGLVSGWVYLRVRDKYGAAAMRAKVFRRAGTIYLTHLAIIAVGIFANLYPTFALQKFMQARATFLKSAAAEPDGMGTILPLYCMFLVFTPLILRQFTAGRAWLVGAISAALWTAAQLGLGESRAIGFTLHPSGFFNVFAWQAYFVAGLYLGYRCVQFGESGLPKSRLLLAACALVTLLLMVDRHLALFGSSPLLGFSGAPNHNPVRFLDAVCLAYLLWCVPRTVDLKFMKVGLFRFLNFLGQHSLQVVAFSLPLTRLEARALGGLSGEVRLCIAVLNVLSLWLPARIHQLCQERARSRRSALPLKQDAAVFPMNSRGEIRIAEISP